MGFDIYDALSVTLRAVFTRLICAIDEDRTPTSRKDTKTAFVNAQLRVRRSRRRCLAR